MIGKLVRWFNNPPIDGPAATLAIRMLAGGVFFSEGILKFVYVNQGVGRFTKLGFPFPALTAHFVGTLEIVGGLMVLAGLFTRYIGFIFIIQMIVAILSTKIGLYLGTSPLPLPPAPPQVGIWAVLHEIRSDYSQVLSCVYLCLAGPGLISLDRFLRRPRADKAAQLAGELSLAHN